MDAQIDAVGFGCLSCRAAERQIVAVTLRRRDRFDKILFCQIQSVAKRAHELGKFDLLLIDEAHRIPLKSEGMYRQFIDACRAFNPALRVVGLTATPYRLQGQAVPVCGAEHILTEIAYEARITDLIADGYLSRLVSKAGECPDLSGVAKRGGEYIDESLAAAMMPLVPRTVADLLARAQGRKAGIVFCVDVKHAEAVLAELQAHGEHAALVHGGTPKGERADLIAAWPGSSVNSDFPSGVCTHRRPSMSATVLASDVTRILNVVPFTTETRYGVSTSKPPLVRCST